MARRARYSKLVTLNQTGHQSASVIGRRGLDGGLSLEPSGLVAVYLELITKENGKLAKSPRCLQTLQTLEESALNRGAVATRGDASRKEVGIADVYYAKVSAGDDTAAERMRTKAFLAKLLLQTGHPTLRVTHEWPLLSGGSSWP